MTSVPESWFQGHLVELSAAECFELLETHVVGRIAYCDVEGPVVLPVNYTLDRGGESTGLLFRTSPHGIVAQHVRKACVAFQVDEADEYTSSGWSVLVRGTASFVSGDELSPVPGDRPSPWAAGTRTLYVRITPTSVTGRRLLAG